MEEKMKARGSNLRLHSILLVFPRIAYTHYKWVPGGYASWKWIIYGHIEAVNCSIAVILCES